MTSNKTLLVIIGALLVLIGVLMTFIFLSSQKNTTKEQREPQKETILGGDKDEHGCIGSAGYTWSEDEQKCIRPWEEEAKQDATTQDKTVTEEYIVSEKSEYIPGGGRKHNYFAIYDLQKKLINTVSLPDDAMRNKAGSNATFGSKIYYLSGSDETTSIAELDPVTGKSHIFNFTKTKSTNIGNVLAAIVGWTVSDDNKMLAWVGTDCSVHIANSDGSNLKNYNSDNAKCISTQISFSKDGKRLYLWNGVSNFLREMIIENGNMSNIVKSENGLFLISPSERYVIYSNFDTPLAIRDFIDNKNVDILLPKAYDFYYLQNFSPDEKTVYFNASIMRGEQIDYVVQTDGSNPRKITGTNENEQVGAFLPSPGHEEEYFLGVIKY